MRTLFQICTTFTIMLFMFTCAVNFVSGLGIYGDINPEAGLNIDTDGNWSSNVNNATKSSDYDSGFSFGVMWALVFAGAGISGILVAWLTHSTAIIGVFIFSAAMWASYINTIGIINIGGWINEGFLLIGTGAAALIWMGAVAGMLSGSG